MKEGNLNTRPHKQTCKERFIKNLIGCCVLLISLTLHTRFEFYLFSGIYFDATAHVAVIGQRTSFTCFVNNVPNGESITVTRGNTSEPVITINTSGDVEIHISHFEAVDDVDKSGLHAVRVTFTGQCGDSAKYFCKSSGMSTAADIYVLSNF